MVQRIYLLLSLCSLLASCVPHHAPPVTALQLQPPADFPMAYYRQAQAAGGPILQIESKLSLLTVTVRRGGVLAKLGHDHIVASHAIAGYVDTGAKRADLYLPLDQLSVDEATLRAAAGFDTQPSAEAIEGTKRNMLTKVLEAASFPYALIHITTDHTSLNVTITLHGATHSYTVPAQLESTADRLEASGQLSIKQSDFGITPYAILGGALQVEDRVELQFKIIATRILNPNS
jgi:hypothetical protein